MNRIVESLAKLQKYCESEDFKGWDPYDGLNSRIFNAIPLLKNSAICRLAMIQLFKRNPINLRRFALIPKDYNPKGIALILTGYCNIYDAVIENPTLQQRLGSPEQVLKKIVKLSQLLVDIRSKGNYHGACWGYEFGWQSKAFYLPAYTPTVVVTSFAVDALFRAYQITRCQKYLDLALSSEKFILNDLNRINKSEGYMFSYSPLDNRAVYNATLLGTKTLTAIYEYKQEKRLMEQITMSIRSVLSIQNPDGSFPHSDQVGNKWRDNFHTGFKLESLARCNRILGDDAIQEALEKGYKHWIVKFFNRESGICLYYDNDNINSSIDLHCLAQAIPTLYYLNQLGNELPLVEKSIKWAIDNMQSSDGGFYYRRKGDRLNKIKYMRWPNAWMFYGMSFYLKYICENGKN
ncbi:MAG: delta-aminolevulinic acid dehydratase [Bacteroides sp.]|nr:delta-aminolevulinic acid dehydratase [Bacteroides sp.]